MPLPHCKYERTDNALPKWQKSKTLIVEPATVLLKTLMFDPKRT
jgi:hypothetical protein